MPKITEARRVAMRDRILDAVEHAWREKGGADITTRDILSRAEVSNGTLYHYFDGKEELGRALAERLAQRNIEALRWSGISDRTLPPDERFARFLVVIGGRFEGSLLPELRARARYDSDIRRGLHRFDALLIDELQPLIED